jgi:NAD(P)-dependent dehydrogenase (short-subunit alcohol dehydrogenase family)
MNAPVAVVTGAAGDIGRAIAVRLGADGYRVALCDVAAVSDRLDAVAAAVRTTGGDDPWIATFDVTDDAAVGDAIDRLTDVVGAPTALANIAGIQGPFAPTPHQPMDQVRQVMDVNVVGLIGVLQAVTARMIDAGGGGAVVNAASMAGVSGGANMLAYSASKGAVIGLTKSAAQDLAPHGIRVNAISPGFIGPGAMWDRQVALQAETPSQYFGDDPETVATQMIEMVPLRRYGTLDEVASVAAFLLSDAAGFVNGANIEISGGGH